MDSLSQLSCTLLRTATPRSWQQLLSEQLILALHPLPALLFHQLHCMLVGDATVLRKPSHPRLLTLSHLPLPFLSSGGSSLMANLLAIGLLLHIYAYHHEY